jgi:hypothetical protein
MDITTTCKAMMEQSEKTTHGLIITGRAAACKTTATELILAVLRATGSLRDANYVLKALGIPDPRVRDYLLMKEMWLKDKEQGRIDRVRSNEWGGFDIIDFRVYDDVIPAFEAQLRLFLSIFPFTIGEIARGQLLPTFQQFDPRLLKQLDVLIIRTPFEQCIKRAGEREKSEKNENGIFSRRRYSDTVFTQQYDTPDEPVEDLTSLFKTSHVIDNVGTLSEYVQLVMDYIQKQLMPNWGLV